MTARRDRLARRRKSLGFSQECLAVTLGVDRTTVGRWERGETDPHPYIRARLSGALQVTSAELDTLITGGPGHGNLPPTRTRHRLAPPTRWVNLTTCTAANCSAS